MGTLRIFVRLLGPHRRGEGMDERSDINPSFIKTIPCKLLLRREYLTHPLNPPPQARDLVATLRMLTAI